MDIEAAAKLEGMVVGSRMLLESLADFVCENLPEEDRKAIALKIGGALAELSDISWALYERHPSLNPYPEETKLAAELRQSAEPGDSEA